MTYEGTITLIKNSHLLHHKKEIKNRYDWCSDVDDGNIEMVETLMKDTFGIRWTTREIKTTTCVSENGA